jgi:hypothetical protein
MSEGASVRDERSMDEWVSSVTTAERGTVPVCAVPGWERPPGSQGCARQTLGAFDGRRLNPVLNDEVGRNCSLH